jgi:hypothetical protein
MNATNQSILPSESEILARIRKIDNIQNGYGSLLDAFLSVIPEQAKIPENDDHIIRRYHAVRRAMSVTQNDLSLSQRNSADCRSQLTIRTPHAGTRQLKWL